MDNPKIEMPVGERAGVLIVDDTPAKLVALAAIVSGMALEVVTVNSGEQALRQLLKRDFAVILLDVNMPMMNGFETATLIRSRPRSEYTPIIFVTAEANSEAERLSGYTLGAVDFIYSPIIPEILRAKVRVFADLFYLQRQVLLHNEHLKQQHDKLNESENRFRVMFERTADALLLLDPGSGQFIDCNQAAVDMLRCTDKKEILLLHPAQISPLHQPDGRRSAEKADEMIATAMRNGSHRFEWIHRSDHREDFPVEVLLTPILMGERQLIIATCRDITERKQAEEELLRAKQESAQAFAELTSYIQAIEQYALISMSDLTGRIIQVNDRFCEVSGYSRAEMLDHGSKIVKSGVHPSSFFAELWTIITRGDIWHAEICNEAKNGSLYWVDTAIVPVKDSHGQITRYLSVRFDITERKQALDRLNYLANNDALTGLPNRVLFKERLEQAMIAAKGHDGLVAVVFLDLVRFKNVNDALGHDAGDQMLKAVAQRLLGTVRSGDTVARLSGDEFTIVLTDIGHVDDAARVAQKILHAFEPPFRIVGRELVMGASLGIAIFPLDTGDASELLSYADIAMYSAKAAGGNRYQFYTAEMTAKAVDALALENELRQGLERGEFFLNYQPIVDAGGNIVGVEALLRWQHGRRGLIPPAIFISLAETTGLILPIGDWVLRQACIQAKAWRKPNGALLRMAVNVSPRQFRHGDLAKTMATILAETGLAPPALDLEITEGVLMQGEPLAQELFHQLSELGLSFSIDDFGTGYSNFAYLKRFPIDSLKIDQSFIRDLSTDPNDAALVKAMIGMAHSLGIKTIAEGVETREQKEFLLAHGCDLMQGYYFSRPLLPEAFTALLDADKPLLGNDPGGS